MNLDVERFLEDVTGRYAKAHAEAVRDLFAAYVTSDRIAFSDARARLADVIRETMGIGEVLGASMVLRDSAALYNEANMTLSADRGRMARFANEPTQSVLPRVTLQEAVDDMVARTPVTIRRAAERTAQTIAKLYSEGSVVAFARSAEVSVTKAAQDFIHRAIREGIPEGEAGKRLAMAVDEVRVESEAWSEAYARMAFRTNMNTAVTAGRFRQAQDPDVKAVIPAFRFSSMEDADVRPNHAAADGVIMAVDNPAWQHIAPPLGYNCRCQVHLVSAPMLMALGRFRNGYLVEDRVPPGAHPDEGFRHGGRPDLAQVT